ncbi:MAG: hypothetical protein KF773_17455 [Deltaproteobacteria bacterium]|nr:hypothetical protein [Deltaproteobacteria bacterium]
MGRSERSEIGEAGDGRERLPPAFLIERVRSVSTSWRAASVACSFVVVVVDAGIGLLLIKLGARDSAPAA